MLTSREAAARLHLGESTVRQKTRNHELPFVQVGRKRLIPERELDKWIREHTVRPDDSA